MSAILFLIVSFLSSTVGAICGIGGGVIIKPVLDMLQMGAPATINFLSGCTVLSMSLYSVSKALRAGDSKVEMSTGTPLALGAALGGIAGKELFSAVKALFGGSPMVGGVQAVALGVITLGTLLYTLNKHRIPTRNVRNPIACVLIGLMLGIMSSFLGIGGGPINLVVLFYFFSMETKVAAANSLYIILFSQTANLLTILFTGSIPPFQLSALVLMVGGGIGGGIVGRKLNKKITSRTVDKLFIGLMVVIVAICVYNSWNAFSAA